MIQKAAARLRPCLLAGLALAQPAAAATLPDGFDVGRGPQGEYCRAERVWNAPEASGLFDRVYDVRCRGWTDTAIVGRVGSFTAGAAATDIVRQAVAGRMTCAAPSAVPIAGIGTSQAARCRNGDGGYEAFSAIADKGGQLLSVDGLERFMANLAIALRVVGGVDMSEATRLAGIDLAGLALTPAAAPDTSGSIPPSAGQRSEVLDYAVRGQYVEARELATRYLARLPATASATERAEFALEVALASSNLGYTNAATAALEQASAAIADPTIAPATAERLRTKLMLYRAMDAMNRRRFVEAEKLAVATLNREVDDTTAAVMPLNDPAILGQLNAGGRGGAMRRDFSWVTPTILEAQAQYVRGAALRNLGRADEAATALAAADQLLARFDDRGIDATSLQWLRSAVAAEQGRLADQSGDRVAAQAYLGRAATMLAASPVYADTPVLAQRYIDLANSSLAAGDAAAARQSFERGFRIMRGLGPTTASAVSGLDGYFDLLAAATPAAISAAEDTFFEAAQLINPPAVAGQIAMLQKIYESGSSGGAVRAKTLQDLDREIRVVTSRLTLLPPTAPERMALEAELRELSERAALVRSELAGDQQYQQASESVVALAELQKALRPGEAYLKLVSLAEHSYAMLIRPDRVLAYRTGLDSAELAQLAQAVRKSIDGTRSASGRPLVLVFDVKGAHQLRQALLGAAGDALDGVTTLITEPTGPMTQLPYSVLVEDAASVAAFEESVRVNSRDYSSVRFLTAARRIDSAVSPRSFLIARELPPSRAALPYMGLGNHLPAGEQKLASLPDRGAFAGQCAASASLLRNSFAALQPVGAEEIAAAKAAMGARAESLQQAAFTDTAVADQNSTGARLREFAVLHFATHGLKEGELDCDSPPALVTSIAEDKESDGLLSFEEIASMSLDANLVALSACNTAASTTGARAGQVGFRSEVGQAATLNGLARAFMVAGSRAVLTTHWAIPDSFKARDGRTIAASTRLIASMFDKAREQPIGDALRGAQLGMIAAVDTSHPYYWGAFMLVGDGDRPMLTPGARAAL